MKLRLTKDKAKMSDKRIASNSSKKYLSSNYKNFGLIILLSSPFIAAYGYKLGSFVRGDSVFETRKYLGLLTSNDLLINVQHFPIKFLQMLALKIDEPNSTLLRLISVSVVFVSIIAMFLVVSRWHSRRISYMTIFLFGLSTFSLNSGRFTTQDVLQLTIFPLLILIGTWLKSKKNINKISISLPIVGLLLYVPGVLLLLIALTTSFRTRAKLAWKYSNKKSKYLGLSGFVLLAMPLIYSLIKYSDQVTKFLGIDLLADGEFKKIFINFKSIPADIFINGPNDPSRWLVGTPILDIASVGLLILGVYYYFKSQHTLRFRLLIGFTLASVFLISTGSVVSIGLLIPALYFFVAKGLTYLLQSWFTVFPKNPAARRSGLIVLSLLLLLVSFYHLQRYFVAWPNTPQTKQSLNIQ